MRMGNGPLSASRVPPPIDDGLGMEDDAEEKTMPPLGVDDDDADDDDGSLVVPKNDDESHGPAGNNRTARDDGVLLPHDGVLLPLHDDSLPPRLCLVLANISRRIKMSLHFLHG